MTSKGASVAKSSGDVFTLDGLPSYQHHGGCFDYQEYLPEMVSTYSCPLSTVMEQPDYFHQKHDQPLPTNSLTSFPTELTDHTDYEHYMNVPFASSLDSSSSNGNVQAGGISDSHSYSSSYGPSLSPPSSPFDIGIHTSLDPPSTILEENGNDLEYQENLASVWKNELVNEGTNASFPEVPVKEESEPLAFYDNEDYCPSGQLYQEPDFYNSTGFPNQEAIEPIQDAISSDFITVPSSPPRFEESCPSIRPTNLTLQVTGYEPSLTDISTPDTPANISPASPFATLTKVEPVSPMKPSFAFETLPQLRPNNRFLKSQIPLAGEVSHSENQTLSPISTLHLDNQQGGFSDIFHDKHSSVPFSKVNKPLAIYERQGQWKHEPNCFVPSENNHEKSFQAVQRPSPSVSEASYSVKKEPLDSQGIEYAPPLLAPKPHPKITENNGCKTSRKQSTRICRIPPETMASLYRGPEEDGKFVCLFNGCCKRIRRKYNIESHIQTHLSDRPYRCEICKAGFVRHHDLKRHLRIHENGRPYICECSKRFNRLDALNRHKQRNICIGGLNRR